jgi:hypothetical protein
LYVVVVTRDVGLVYLVEIVVTLCRVIEAIVVIILEEVIAEIEVVLVVIVDAIVEAGIVLVDVVVVYMVVVYDNVALIVVVEGVSKSDDRLSLVNVSVIDRVLLETDWLAEIAVIKLLYEFWFEVIVVIIVVVVVTDIWLIESA